MAPRIPIRAAALAGLFCLVSSLAASIVSGVVSWVPGAAAAAELRDATSQTQMIAVPASGYGSRFFQLGKGKSMVIDFQRDIKDVLVGDAADTTEISNVSSTGQ